MRPALPIEESRARAVSRSVADVGQNAGALGQCRAVVVSCIDYRFVEPLRRFLADQRLTGTVDLIAWPGGAAALTTPDRDAVVDAIGLACKLHGPAEILLVAHHDCGRLGGSVCFPGRQAEIATLDTALAIAAEIVADRFPALRIRLVRLDLDGPPAVVETPQLDPVDASQAHRAGSIR